MMIRLKTFTRIQLAGGLFLPVAQFAAAQQPRPFNPGTQPGARQGNDLPGRSDANRPMNGEASGNQILRGSQIIGSTVDLRGGSRLGTVQDFVVGEGGCVEYVVAAYGDQFIPIPWGAAMYQPGQRILMVDIDPGRIHEMPMYHQISELTNRQFSERVNTFYRGTNGRAGDMHPRGSDNHQGVNNPQPAPRTETRSNVGRTQSTTQGNRTGRIERPGDKR